MANKRQLKLLEQGVEDWNKWRTTNRNRKIDLSEININDGDFEGINLSGANLEGAVLTNSKLKSADLSNANLTSCSLFSSDLRMANLNGADISLGYLNGANLKEAQIRNADLSHAYLVGASLEHADLTRSKLRQACLIQADFSGALLHATEIVRSNLLEAIFTSATMAETVLTQLDLSTVVDLEWVVHNAPCHIDDFTLGKGKLPEAFLRGCGLPDRVIQVLVEAKRPKKSPALCFISYAEADVEPAIRLHDSLQSSGIRSWMISEKSKSIENLITENGQLNRLFDKLLLIVSKNSLSSDWIEEEVKATMTAEQAEEDEILLPIAIDDSGADFESDWFGELKKNHNIINFSSWNQKGEFVRKLGELLELVNKLK